MRNIFTRLLVVSLLLLVTATVSAQLASLEVGKVYRFVNARTAGRSLNGCGSGKVNTTTTDANDLKQQWYVTKDGDYYVLRNLYYAQYLKGVESLYTAWTMTDDYSATQNKFELVTSNSTLNTLKIKGSDTYGHMHDSNNGGHYDGYSVVKWLNNDSGSYWTIHEVTYSNEELKTILDAHPTVAEVAAWATNFRSFFNDDACTTSSYATLELAKAAAEYSSLSADLQALVDEIYTKVLSDNWEEDNAVDGKDSWGSEYAKKFRVQMYEPYSIAGDITSWLGINAHANNDNPTGIHVPEAGTLYVMVEGTIKDGASLRIVDGGHNWRVTEATSGGYALKPGLNVINYTGTAGQLYICYNVDTYNPDGATTAEKFPHKLSEYPPLKIHIEGGAITGYYNACGDFRAADSGTEDLWKTITGASVDNDADWEYMETRANLNVIPLLAHRQILLFHLNDYTHEDGGTSKGMASYLPDLLEVPANPYNSTKNWADYGMECDPSKGKINIMLEAWDRIMYSELATMGLVSQSTMVKMNNFYPRWESDHTTKYEMYDYTKKSPIDNKTYQEFCNGLDYSEYFNHHGVALGTESGYMYGGWDHCGYNITTYNGIVQNMANNAGSTWGPAHEIGHQHQAPLTLNGLTEVTNNLFSNIALWYKGMSTSRYNGNDGSLERVLNAYNTEGSDIYTNNIWALTHLYYRLWLYYHLAGNNTQFWPRLYELLRQQPMQKGYNVSGDVSTLHFYKLACQAAGEDLTEFFRAHGYFSIMDDRLVGDYSNSVYEVSQEMIDEAIAEVKEMGYEENLAIIFICDDVYTTIDGKKYAAHYQHDGTTLREIYGETSPNSDFGAVSDFINGNVSVKTTYTATLNSDATLTMSGGEGGVGFLVLNEDGEIVSFSNKSTFAISDEAAYLLATGKASVVAVDTESTTTEAEVDVTAMRFALLQELIENAIALTQNTSETRVGFYKPSAVTNLQGYVTMAQEVIANGDLANLQAVYELLYNEYKAVVANEFSRVTFVPGSKYAIINKGAERIMSAADGYVTTVAVGSDYENTAANQWYLERDVAFRLKNVGTNTYAQEVTDQNGIRFTVAADVVDYNITETSLGWYSLACSRVPSRYMNMNGANTNQVITWGSMGDDNSQWKFILLEADDTNTAKEELLELSKKTLALVNEVATVSYNEGRKISLQSSSSTTANYIWSNAAVSGNDVDKLLDSDKNTFFHSQWNNSTAPADGWGHHLTVDLGDNPSLTSFKFKFTTRNQSNLSNYPKTIEVYGSNVGGNDVANYTKLQVASGFATGAGVDNEAVVMGNGTAYRYLRFLVTDATGNNSGTNTGSDGMVFFHMSEFSIYPVTVSATVKSDYTSGVTVDAVLAAYNDAEQGKTVYNNASATLADINAKKTALGDGTAAGSYTTLLAQYNNVLNSVINAKKAQLLTLITNTNNLIKTVGSVEFTDVPLVLTTENLYCNDPCLRNDNDYSADYVDKLTDGNHSTYLHTDWDGSNSAGSAPHYLRVDMGEGETISQFKFSYTTRSDGRNCPTTIVVEGSNDVGGNGTYTTITTLTKDANGLPENYATFNSETIKSTVPYRYIRFRVTATKSGDSFFVMSEFSFTKANQPVVTMTNTSTKADEALVLDTYLATTKSQKLHDAATTVALLDAAIADQQAAYGKLDEAINNTTALKESLLELINDTQALYDEMAADGSVNDDYITSELTNEQLVAVAAELASANDVYENATTQAQIGEAKVALQRQYDVLAAVEATNEKDNLDTTNDLDALIGSVNTLLTTISDEAASNLPLRLQTTANKDFYLSVSATGSGEIANLIDKNSDGSANIDSYFGTAWNGVAAYSQYVQVDLGDAVYIQQLLFDYTTRNDAGRSSDFPSAIKVLGSNDGTNFTEVTSFTENLATTAGTKWAMAEAFEMPVHYRYLRFAAIGTTVNSFNMSDFNLYVQSDRTVKDYYATAAELDLAGLVQALQSAQYAMERGYITQAQYDAAYEMLDKHYQAATAVVNADQTDRNSLPLLIESTKNLLDEVAAINEEAAALALQANNAGNDYYIWTNAPRDDTPVSNLLQDAGSFHSQWESGAPDENHYLAIDMGEGNSIGAFTFNYTTVTTGWSKCPSAITVQGSNDFVEFTDIASLTSTSDRLPVTDTATDFTSNTLNTGGNYYRYLRFVVTANKEGGTVTVNDTQYAYFQLSKFGVTSQSATISIEDEFASPNLPVSLVTSTYSEQQAAEALITNNAGTYLSTTEYTAAYNELKTLYNQLLEAKGLVKLPMRLTTDVANPVLYNIYINRGNNNELTKALAYDASSSMVAVEDFTLGRKAQGWYFMKGTDDDSAEDILIFPYWNNDAANTTLRLASNSISEGNSKVEAVDGTDAAYTQNWYIKFVEGTTETGWSNLQIQGNTTLYFSNHGGVSQKMGFLNDAGDNGSEFQFVLADFSKSEAYHQLNNLYADCGEAKVCGTAIGCYTESSVEAYNNAYNVAADKLAKVEAEDDEYNAARIALEEAYNALTRNMPVKDGFYKIRSAFKTEANADGYSYDGVVYADDKNDVYWAKDYDITSARAIWYIEPVSGGYNIKNMHTGCSFTTLGWGAHSTLSTTPATFTIDVLDDATGILKLIAGYPMHAQESGNKIVGYSGDLNTASAWVIEEISVDDVVANVEYTVTLGNNTVGDDQTTAYSSLCLGYPVTLPDDADVVAYTITAEPALESVVQLTSIAGPGETIPANTPVILKGTTNNGTTCELSFAAPTGAVATVDAATNLLGGTTYAKYLSCFEGYENVYNIYMLTRKNGLMAMRWVYENYQLNGDGTYSKVANANSNDGGYVLCPANKAYLKLGGVGASLSAEYFFSFFDTTDIDTVESEKNPLDGTIYDLQGRKIDEVTTAGFYIVNGEKVYVNPEMLK